MYKRAYKKLSELILAESPGFHLQFSLSLNFVMRSVSHWKCFWPITKDR